MVSSSTLVVCCGLSCLDVELCNTSVPCNREAVVPFSGTEMRAGGSAPQTATALTALGVSTTLLTAVGSDENAKILRNLCHGVEEQCFVVTHAPTAVAYLPVFSDGTRGCFVDLGSNLHADSALFAPHLESMQNLRVFHFGYPHLMPMLQGDALHALFLRVQNAAPNVVITLDINGVAKSEADCRVLAPACELVGAIHANADEAMAVAGVSDVPSAMYFFTHTLHAAVVLVTCGKNGVFSATGCDFRARTRCKLPGNARCYKRAYELSKLRNVNASGAGDAFCAGIAAHIAANGISGEEMNLASFTDAGLASAAYRLDPSIVGEEVSVTPHILQRKLSAVGRIEPDDEFGDVVSVFLEN